MGVGGGLGGTVGVGGAVSVGGTVDVGRTVGVGSDSHLMWVRVRFGLWVCVCGGLVRSRCACGCRSRRY